MLVLFLSNKFKIFRSLLYAHTTKFFVAADEGKKYSESVKNDDDDDTNSGSSEKQGNSNDEKDDVFEQGKYNDEEDEIEDKPIGANSEEWKADREVHREANKSIKEIQEEEGEALLMPEEFALWYPEKEEKKPKEPTIQSPEKGSVPTKTQEKVNKILENVMNHTKPNISIGQLLEIAPYCQKQVMAALTSQEKKLEK